MRPVQVECEVKPRDMVEVALFDERTTGAIRYTKIWYAGYGVIFTLIGSVGFVVASLYPKVFLGSMPHSILIWALGVVWVMSAVLHVTHLRGALSRHYATPRVRRFLGPCSFAVTDEGFTARSPGGVYHHPWPAVVAVAVTAEHAFVTAALVTYPVPRRAFPDAATFDDFVTAAQEGIERNGSIPCGSSADG